MSCAMKTPCAGAEWLLPQKKGNKMKYRMVWSMVFLNHRYLSVGEDMGLTSQGL